MTRPQFWILTFIVLLVGPFFLTDLVLSHLNRNGETKIMVMERIAEEGNGYTTRWQQLAVRVYQASQQDAALKDVLAREHINIAPKPASGAPTASGTVTQ